MKMVENRSGTEILNKLYLLALREIGFKGSEEEIVKRAGDIGKTLLDSMKEDEADSLVMRPKGSGPLPMRVQVSELGVFSGQPVEFMARLAALASNGGGAYVKDIEVGWAREKEVRFPVFNLSSGELKPLGRFREIMTKVRRFGVR